MKREIWGPGQQVPVYVWRRDADEASLRQLCRVASMPYAALRVCGMPDLHLAHDVAVGTVFATRGVVVPGALGGDLGCGMSAVCFDLHTSQLDLRTRQRLLEALSRAIPAGDDLHRGRPPPLPDALASPELSSASLCRDRDRLGPRSLGTLGGGNHFVELSRDVEGALWLLVHTGSRGLGGAIAAHHRGASRAEGALTGLRTDEPAGRAYLDDHAFALSFAAHNRSVIVERAAAVIHDITGASPLPGSLIDVHHNHVAPETHDGEEVLVHRKGAIRAREGDLALVPGSMGSASYLLRGKGSRDSLCSCSHGAGRVMSRSEARARISPRALAHRMGRVVFDIARAASLVEEAPEAYRDIREVLDDEADLAEPELRLEPLVVMKG